MTLSVVVSLAVGFGLMALIFYSSRKGHDEAPVLIVAPNDLEESGRPPGTRIRIPLLKRMLDLKTA